MSPIAAFPFTLKRGDDAYSGASYTSTTETIHGLLHLDGDRVVVQWRLSRKTDHVGGTEIRSESEIEPVREVVVPLAGIAGAVVRGGPWTWLGGHRLVLTAADLRAFEEVTGEEGLALKHPAELVLPVRRRDRLAAEEFCAELALAIAQLGQHDALPGGRGGERRGGALSAPRTPRKSDGSERGVEG